MILFSWRWRESKRIAGIQDKFSRENLGLSAMTSLRVLNEDESLGRSLNLELEGDYHPKGLVTRDRFSSPLIDRLPLSC